MSATRCIIVSTIFLAGCSPGIGDRVEIKETRQRVVEDEKAYVGATSRQRFLIGEDPTVKTKKEDLQNPFVWEVPDGWKVGRPSRLRIANFSFGKEGRGECYLTVLPGGGGGILANVNRWRSQMGQPPISEEDMKKMPQGTLFGIPAVMVDLEGAFKGMGETRPRSGYRLLGLIQEHSGFTFFVKMTGPEADVIPNKEKFEQFGQSIAFAGRRN